MITLWEDRVKVRHGTVIHFTVWDDCGKCYETKVYSGYDRLMAYSFHPDKVEKRDEKGNIILEATPSVGHNSPPVSAVPGRRFARQQYKGIRAATV